VTILAAPSGGDPAAKTAARPLLIPIFVTIAILQLATFMRREVNWDEYRFLSLVFEYRRGELHAALQTFHVHLFSWLPLLPGDEMSMIVTGRSVMWLLHMATLLLLYRTARYFVSDLAALWAVTTYATMLFVAQHATSFRADPVITALLVGALFGLTRNRLGLARLTMTALAVAFAGLISIKSVFYVPIIAAVACLRLARSQEKGLLARDMGIALLVAALFFAGALAWHANLLGASAAVTGSGIAGASGKQFAEAGLFYTAFYLVYSLVTGPLQWAAILLGVGTLAFTAFRRTGLDRPRMLVLLSFASPLLLLAFYRNSFPYFYVFMLAPVSIVAGLAVDGHAFVARHARTILVFLLLLAVLQFFVQSGRTNQDQRTLIGAVHELFPEPVPYIDRAGMIASFPNAGFLMSGWGMEGYRKRGSPVISRAIETKKPPFVIVSGYPLTAAMTPGDRTFPEYELLEADVAALRENYIPHWGPLWVAGKRLGSSNGGENRFSIIISGNYTVEAAGPIEIDGQALAPGQVLILSEGDHSHRGPHAVLRFGENLPVPSEEPPAAVFTGF